MFNPLKCGSRPLFFPAVADSGVAEKQMRISVIVPVRDEENSIAPLLDALLSQSLAPDEIVITDGGSLDQTVPIIQKYIEQGAPVQLIRTTGALPGRGRNLAASRASGQWLAFTDGGNRPETDWLAALAQHAQETNADVIYGGWEPVIDTFFKECATIAYVPPPVDVDGTLLRPRSIVSALMRRSVWEQVGGFPEHLRSAEDLLFMNKIEAADFKIGYTTRGVVHWQMQPTLWRTFKRFAVYARNNIRAGLWSQWQGPIVSRYGVLVIIALAAIFVGRWWLFPAVGLWLLMLLARAAAAIYRNRHCYPASRSRNLARALILVPLIAVLDAGAIAGTAWWVLSDKLRLRGGVAAVSHGS